MARFSSTLALWLFAMFAALVVAQNTTHPTHSTSLVSVLSSIKDQLPECAVRRLHCRLHPLHAASIFPNFEILTTV